MRYDFERDIYDSLDEFIKEYSSTYDPNVENSRGIDFSYKGVDYRICREYDEVFYIYKVYDDDKNLVFNIISICNSMEELLENTSIANVKFREIVMDEENTRIYGKEFL